MQNRVSPVVVWALASARRDDRVASGARRSPLLSTTARLLRGNVGQSVALALLAAAFLARALFTGGVFLAVDTVGASLPWSSLFPRALAHNGLLSDTVGAYLPWRVFFDQTIRSGAWPLWNPYILAGHPTFASISEQAFYPLNVLFALVPAQDSFGWLAWIHLSVLGIGTRLFARLHLADDASACLAAILVMFAGPTVVWLEYPFYLSTLAWTGLLFYFLERTLRARSPTSAVAAGLTLGLALLGGHAQLALYVAVIGCAYLVGRLVSLVRHEPRAVPVALALVALALAIGGGIGAIAYIPAFELAGLSQRSPLSLDRLVETTLPTQNLVTFVLPNAFGTPVRHDFVGVRNYNEATVYVGLLPILLGVPFFLRRRWNAGVWALALCTGLFGLALFGWRPAVATVGAMPEVRYFVLNRLAIVLPFLVGILAAVAYAGLPTTGPRRLTSSIGVLATTGAVAALIALAGAAQSQRPGPDSAALRDILIALALLAGSSAAVVSRIWTRPQSAWCWLGPLVLFVDLASYGWDYNTVVRPDLLGANPTPPLGVVATGPMAPRTVGITTDRWAFLPNLGMLWNIPTPDGYTSEFLARYGAFADQASPISGEGIDPSLHIGEDLVNFNQARDPFLALLGARYIVTGPDPEFPDALPQHPDGLTQAIVGQTTVGAFFRARQNGLHRIDVYPTRSGGSLTHWLALHLKAWPNPSDHLAYVRINPDAVVDGKPLTFYFKPIADSAGHLYYFYLDAPEGTAEDSVRLGLSQPTASGGGSLVVNGTPTSGTLAFATYAAPNVNWQLLAQANGTAVWENPNALPRAFVIGHVAQLSDQEFYAALDGGAFDPGVTAAVSEAPAGAFAGLATAPTEKATGRAELSSAGPNEVSLQVTLDRPGLVVISNTWYPGWLVTVDGKPETVERVDAVFQGVYVAGGSHQVRLVFSPASLDRGLILGGIALALAGFILLRGVVRRRPRSNGDGHPDPTSGEP